MKQCKFLLHTEYWISPSVNILFVLNIVGYEIAHCQARREDPSLREKSGEVWY